MRRAAVLCLIAVLAGGAAVAGASQAGAGRPHWRVLVLPVRPGRPYSFAEPGIAVGPHGLLIVDAASANTGAPPTFWLSRDGGRRWSHGRDFDPTGSSTGDADAAIGSDGFMYALKLGYNPNPPGQPANPTVLVYRSRTGRKWSGPASFPAPHGGDQPDRPWLVVDPRRPAHVDVVNSEGGGNIVIWRSADHGAHFTGPYPMTGGPNSQAALALGSRPLFDPTRQGRMFMLYETASGTPEPPSPGQAPYEFPLRELWLATSTDSGLTWSDSLVLNTDALGGALHDATLGHLLVASAIDRRGHLYAALSMRPSPGTATAIYLLHSTSHGTSWSSPRLIHTPTASNVMPALAVSPQGVAYLSWYGSMSSDWRSSDARWVEMFARVAKPLAGQKVTLRQVSGRLPIHHGGIDTAGALASDLGANWGLRDFQSITAGPCGQPELVWAVDDREAVTETASPLRRC